MIAIDETLTAAKISPQLTRLWDAAAPKIRSIADSAQQIGGTPVFTVEGRYVAQGWTEWTQGFQFGCPLLLFDATDQPEFLELGRSGTRLHMASHVTHVGVHDHGFNQISTYGNLRRLMLSGRVAWNDAELAFYELAIQASGAVQANRWTQTADGGGFIYSFNGPHSLFSDTIRSLRALAMAHQLGHVLWAENDRRISLLHRLIQHAATTAQFNVYYGEGRDVYDVPGRVVHESIFNVNDGQYRCPSTQQGYSPFSTWTRGLAWILCGYAEQLEFLEQVDDRELDAWGGRQAIAATWLRAATVTADFYLEHTPTCGVPYWDTGAPGLVHLADYTNRPADPFNRFEPVDSSAAAIAAQGLLRLGQYLQRRAEAAGLAADSFSESSPGQDAESGRRYWQAGLTVLRTLLAEPYLATNPAHQGLLLHVVYHRPRDWDHRPPGSEVPCGESCLWGDYHLLEAALVVQRAADDKPAYRFFGDAPHGAASPRRKA